MGKAALLYSQSVQKSNIISPGGGFPGGSFLDNFPVSCYMGAGLKLLGSGVMCMTLTNFLTSPDRNA